VEVETMAKAKKKDQRSEIQYKFAITDHQMVPKHELLTEDEKKEVLEQYSIGPLDLPKILVIDPVIIQLINEGEEIQPGDVLKITRKSQTAGVFTAYRLVVEQG